MNKVFMLGLAGLLMATPAVAQPVSDARVAELLQLVQHQPPESPSPAPTAASSASTLDLTLDEAVRRALERNLDLAVERLNPETFDLQLQAIRGAFRPTISSVISRNDTTQLPTNQLVGGARVQVDTNTYNFGLSQNLPWWGGNYSFTFNNRKQDSTSTFVTFNPQFNAVLTANYTQPLLRGFRIDLTRQQLIVTRINREISEIQLRALIVNTLADVRNAYWDYLYTVLAYDVAQRSLELAEKLVDDNKVRVEVGTLAPIDVVQAEAEAATRRQALAQAEASQQTAHLALKRLIVSGTDDPYWNARINPVDRPAMDAPPMDLPTVLRTALEQRADLQQARKQLQSNTATLRYLKDQRLPQLDLVSSYALQGIGGPLVNVDPVVPGDYRDALRRLRDRDYPMWTVGIQMSYPLGTAAADAQYARARIQITQTEAQIRSLELQVATEVSNAVAQVDSNLKRVDAGRAARELAERRLEAEQSKFEVGMSTNFFVVQAQRDLADAENTELRALLDYRKSLVDLDRLQQTSVSRASSITQVSTQIGATSGIAGGLNNTGGQNQGR